VLEYIHAHLGDALDIRGMATTANLSRFHFARAFKAATGQTPYQYVSTKRLERAKAMLAQNQPLAQIALALNFSSQARRRGGIINIASNASFQPLPAMATYAATKAFVLHFSEALSYELAGDGVHVMAACPGPTATHFFDGTTTNMSVKDLDSSESVVQKTLDAFDRGKSVAHPTRFSVRLGTLLPRFLPRSLVTRIAGMATRNMGLH
jgi:short-subunit dehydrogenase